MNLNRYDPSDSSTWKDRFTKKGLQREAQVNTGKITVFVVVAVISMLLSSVIVLGIKNIEDIKNIDLLVGLLFFALPIVIFGLVINYAFMQAENVVRKFYQPLSDDAVSRLIQNKIFVPQQPLIRALDRFPDVILAKVDDLDENHFVRWFGGPVRLIIYDGVAVYVERGNRFSRVLGPGLPLPVLEKHERIKAIVNLRPVEKDDVVKAWTKDGVQVDAHVQAEVQILSSDEAKQKSIVLEEGQEAINLIYPFDADNVKRIVENVAVAMDNKTRELSEKIWHDAAMGSITGGVKAHISRYSLNELITRDENSPQFLSFEVSNMLFDSIASGLANSGYELLDLQITKFTPVDKEIKKKLEEYWEAKKEKEETIRKGRADAQDILAKQNAYTLAYQETLSNQISQVQEMNQNDRNYSDISIDSTTEASVMLLAQVLEKTPKDPLMGTLVAREMLRTLDLLREQLNS